MQGRVASERAAALAQLAPLDREGWWQRLDQGQLIEAYEVAHAWESVDDVARRHADRLRAEISTRYGVDPMNPQADPAAVRGELARVEAERAQAAAILADAGDITDRASDAEAQVHELLDRAVPFDEHTTLEQRAGDLNAAAAGDQVAALVDLTVGEALVWDSTARRQDLADRLAAGGVDPATADAWLTADKGHGLPPAAAARPPRWTSKARTSVRGAGPDREQVRDR